MPFKSEKGPWSVRAKGREVSIESDDFTHDVTLIMTGDFATNEDRAEYAVALAAVLNSGMPLRSVPMTEAEINIAMIDDMG